MTEEAKSNNENVFDAFAGAFIATTFSKQFDKLEGQIDEAFVNDFVDCISEHFRRVRTESNVLEYNVRM